jgi:hypothetical protein
MAPRQYYVAVGTQEAKLVRVPLCARTSGIIFESLRCVVCAQAAVFTSLTKHNQHT